MQGKQASIPGMIGTNLSISLLRHAWLPAAEVSASKDLHGHAEELIIDEPGVDGVQAHEHDAVPVCTNTSTPCMVRMAPAVAATGMSMNTQLGSRALLMLTCQQTS